MNFIPHELAIGDVYLPPVLVAAIFALIATIITVRLLTRYRLSRYLYNPQLVCIAIVVIYTVLIGTFFIRI